MEVRNIDESEKGLFATKNYLVGDVILQEKPLHIVGEVISNETFIELKKLKNSLNNEISGHIKTNQIGMTIEKSGVFKTISRCNHSCIPNARYFWNTIEKQEYLIALKDINSNEEITVSYGNTYFMPKIIRQNYLSNWNFTCQCLDCKNDLTEEIRLKLYHLNNYFEKNCSNENFNGALTNSIEMLKVIKESVLEEPCLLSIIYYDIYQVFMYLTKCKNAETYLKKYLELISICETSKSQNFIEKSKYISNPQKFMFDKFSVFM